MLPECSPYLKPTFSIPFSQAESLLSNCYAGTGKYYRGDTAGSDVCVRDCNPEVNGDTTCGGLVEGESTSSRNPDSLQVDSHLVYTTAAEKSHDRVNENASTID